MNEKGFTLLETLLAFTIVIIMITTIMPMFVQLIFMISDKRDDLTATRLLSEFVQMTEIDDAPKEMMQTSRGMNYFFKMEYDDKGELYACAQYGEKKKCIQ